MPYQNPLKGVTHVDEVWRLAALYEVWIDMQPIKVKILEKPNGKFLAITDHSVKTAKLATSYKSLEQKDTPDDALRDAVLGLLTFYKPEEADTCWIKDEDF